MHTRTILHQTCIRDRPAHIYNTVNFADDLLDHILQLLHLFKAAIPAFQPAAPFHENMILSVYHNLRHLRIIHQFLQDIQSPEAVKKPVFQINPLSQGQILPLCHSGNGLFNAVIQFVIPNLLKTAQRLPHLAAQLVQQFLCMDRFLRILHQLHHPLLPIFRCCTCFAAQASFWPRYRRYLNSRTKSPRSLHKSCSR